MISSVRKAVALGYLAIAVHGSPVASDIDSEYSSASLHAPSKSAQNYGLYFCRTSRRRTASNPAAIPTDRPGNTHTLSTRDYYTDTLPRGWWKVSLITIALLLAIPLLVIGVIYACACCCGTPIPRFRLVHLPRHERHLDEGKLEEGSEPNELGNRTGLTTVTGQGTGPGLQGQLGNEGRDLPPAPAYSAPVKGEIRRGESDLGRKAKLALGITRYVPTPMCPSRASPDAVRAVEPSSSKADQTDRCLVGVAYRTESR